MNDTQRQILADRIDFLTRDADARQENIWKLEASLLRANARLKVVREELAELQEGVDW